MSITRLACPPDKLPIIDGWEFVKTHRVESVSWGYFNDDEIVTRQHSLPKGKFTLRGVPRWGKDLDLGDWQTSPVVKYITTDGKEEECPPADLNTLWAVETHSGSVYLLGQ